MIRPLRDNLIIKREQIKDKTDSGIFLPTERTMQGISVKGAGSGLNEWGFVLSVGPDVKGIKIGEKVLYTKLLAHKLTQDDEGMAIIVMAKEDIIHCVEDI